MAELTVLAPLLAFIAFVVAAVAWGTDSRDAGDSAPGDERRWT